MIIRVKFSKRMWRTVVCGWPLLCLFACGCGSIRSPSVVQHSLSTLITELSHTPDSMWAIENLRPEDKAILIEGRTIPFSIDMKVSGDGQYALTFSSDKKEFRPFLIRTIKGHGEVDFSGTITWFAHVSGKSEIVTVALYHIEESDSSETEVKTLVKQIRRKYLMVCDKNQWIVMLLLKKTFGMCNCESKQTRHEK